MSYDNLETVALSFYVLEGLFSDLAPRVKPHLFPEGHTLPDRYPHNITAKRLFDEVTRYRTWFHRRLARTLRDSLAGMCLGEARHANDREISRGPFYIDGFPINGVSKSAARKAIFRDIELFSLKDITALQPVFEGQNWHGGGYGGLSWAKLVEMVNSYPKTDKSIFCDTVFHAVHNGGCAYNKGLLISVSNADRMRLILDIKFSADVLRSGELYGFSIGTKVHDLWRSTCKVYDALGLPSLNEMEGWTQQFARQANPKLRKINWAKKPLLKIDENPGNCGCGHEDCDWCYEVSQGKPKAKAKLKKAKPEGLKVIGLQEKVDQLLKDAEVQDHGEEEQVEEEQEKIGSIVYSTEAMPLRQSVGG